MHYLVTGGTGFIGKALCRALLQDGDRVSVLTRHAARAARVLPAGARPVESLESLRDGVAPEVIVNLAGENLAAGRWTAARKHRLLDSRVLTTRRLVEYCRGAQPRPRILISSSAIGWYGARGDETLAEQSSAGRADDFAAQLCRAWEAEAQAAERLGLRVCRLRTGLTLGRDGGPLKKMLPAFRLGLGGRFGDGRQWMSWIHRADLVAMIQWLVRHETLSGAFNGTAPDPVRNRDFVRTLAAVLHRPAVLPVPGFALRLLLGEMAELLLGGQKVLPVRALEAGFEFQHPQLAAALTDLLSH